MKASPVVRKERASIESTVGKDVEGSREITAVVTPVGDGETRGRAESFAENIEQVPTQAACTHKAIVNKSRPVERSARVKSGLRRYVLGASYRDC
jgi:hypothetical protein